MPPKRMTANPTRPARYRAGKPIPGDRSESSNDEEDEEDEEAEEKEPQPAPAPASRPQAGTVISTGLQKVDLNRRFQKQPDEESEEEEEDSEDEENEKSENDEATTKRPAPSGDYESEDSDDSDDSSEEEEEEKPKKVLLRPTFIPKNKRNVPTTTLEIKTDEDLSAEAARKRAEAQEVIESAIRKDAIERNSKSKRPDRDMIYAEPPDDTDDLDPAAERAAWKLRELLRIKRAREAIENMEKEREEIEARRNMDEGERYKEDMEYVRKQREEAAASKGKMGFMQKFYHKGAFYQDDSEILKRDYATAKVEDQVMNREVLPKALQVRSLDQLGKRGRTKWTHLAAEDTSSIGKELDNPWFQKRSKGKFEEIAGMRDERFMSERMREKKRVERGEGTSDHHVGREERKSNAPSDAPKGPRDRREDRDRDRGRRDVDSYRPSGEDDLRGSKWGRDNADDDKSSKERERYRSRSPRRDRYHEKERDRDRDRDYDKDTYHDGRRSNHDRYNSRWDDRGDKDRKRGGDEVHLDEKRRKIDA